MPHLISLIAIGLYTSGLPSAPSNEILLRPSLIPYPVFDDSALHDFARRLAPSSPSLPAIPIAVAVSQWHWLLLYSDRVVGVSRENEKVVWEEKLPLVSSLLSQRHCITYKERSPQMRRPLACLQTPFPEHSGYTPINPYWRSWCETRTGMYGVRNWRKGSIQKHLILPK